MTVKNSPYIGVDGFPISPQVGRIVAPQVIIEEAIVATKTSQTAQALKEWVARHCHRAYGSTSANLHCSHNLRFVASFLYYRCKDTLFFRISQILEQI